MPKPSIAELEKLLVSDEDPPVEILPSGEVRYCERDKRTGKPKLVTPRDDIGNNY